MTTLMGYFIIKYSFFNILSCKNTGTKPVNKKKTN